MNLRTTVIATALAICVSPTAEAQLRYVVVNGQLLHPLQVAQIEQLFCSPIANGRYWYDRDSGIWGYEADPTPQGRFINRCSLSVHGKSLSERGLLYRMGEILDSR